MDAGKFTYERTSSGWQLQTDDPGLGGPLEGAFRYELRLGDLPVHLAAVGHCRVMGLWCVFVREAGSSVVRGIALQADRYGAHDFDPFNVATEVLESESVREALGTEPVPGGLSRHGATAEQGYLAEARRRFLLGSLTARQSMYCSVLPPGFSRRLSPLSCFVVENGHLSADYPAAPARTADRDQASASPESAPPPPTPPLADRRPTQPIPIPPTATLLPDTESAAAQHVSTRGRDGDTDDGLERDEVRMELERVERDLTRRLQTLQIALVVATALLTAALAVGLWWTSKQLHRIQGDPIPAQKAHEDDGSNGRWLP